MIYKYNINNCKTLLPNPQKGPLRRVKIRVFIVCGTPGHLDLIKHKSSFGYQIIARRCSMLFGGAVPICTEDLFCTICNFGGVYAIGHLDEV